MKWDHNLVETGDDPTRPVFTTNPYEPPAAKPTRRQWSPMTYCEKSTVGVSCFCIALTLVVYGALVVLHVMFRRQWSWEDVLFPTCYMTLIYATPMVIATLSWVRRNLQ